MKDEMLALLSGAAEQARAQVRRQTRTASDLPRLSNPVVSFILE
jgi:hypothetical protein